MAFVLGTFSQSNIRTCGTSDYMSKMMQNASFSQRHNTLQKRFQEKINSRILAFTGETYVIPVAVHFPGGSEVNRACLEALAQNQIEILNNDYKGINPDISNWSAASVHYPGVATGVFSLRFEIARLNHPNATDNDLVEGQPAVTIGYDFGGGSDSDTKWAGYLNFLIKDIGTGLLGYSIVGGNPLYGDTVVMNLHAFGSGTGCSGGYNPRAPFNLGRTVTHELGHHFNLRHTWGNGGCSSDDNVADTPNISSATYNKPSPGAVVQCGNKSLTMNFMDYVDDVAMYMFTVGQVNRAQTFLDTVYSNYTQNVLNVTSDFETSYFSIYPNPIENNTLISIQLKSLHKNDISVEVYDITGKSVQHELIKKGLLIDSFKVKNVNSGIYFIKMTSNEFSIVKKIMVK